MEVLSFIDTGDLDSAAAVMRDVLGRDGVALIPTETYYGLAADPFSTDAVERVFSLKDRPAELALPILAGTWEQIEALVVVPEPYRELVSGWWPGPVTVVFVTKRPMAACRGGTAAVRIPGHPLLRRLLTFIGPVTGTSANRHGADPAISCAVALRSIVGCPDLVLDGGSTAGERPSAIVDLSGTELKVLRGDPQMMATKTGK